MAFAENLKIIREGMHLTKAQAATRIGMTCQQYDMLEREGSNPTIKTVERIALNFGVSKSKLMGK